MFLKTGQVGIALLPNISGNRRLTMRLKAE
jgi:hypothetical protein